MAASDFSSVAEARELLPAWVVWGSDAVFVALALLVSAPAVWWAIRFALRPLDRAVNLHWTELARLSYSARSIPTVGALLYVPLVLLCGMFIPADLSPLPRIWLTGVTALTLALLMVAIHCRLENRLGDDQLTFQMGLRSVATRSLLFGSHLLLAVAAIPIIPGDFSPRTIVKLLLVGIVGLILTAGGNLSVLRFLGLARNAAPRLHDICRRAAAPFGLQLRGVYEIDWAMVNALAFPGIQCVAFTTRAGERLSDDELLAICGHEFGHLRESKSALFTRIAVAVLFTLLIAAVRPIAATFGLVGLLAGVIAIFVLSRLFAGFSKRMEVRADAAACSAEPDPGTFARALERLYELNLIPAVIGHGNALHPDLYDRLVAAGVEPAYPRPAPVSRQRAYGAAFLMLSPLVVASVAVLMLAVEIDSAAPDDEAMQKLALATQIDPARSLGNLGQIRLAQGKYSGAIVLLRAATDLDQEAWSPAMHLARAYLAAGGADDAAAAIKTARDRRARALPSEHADTELEQLAQSIDARRGILPPRVAAPGPQQLEPVRLNPGGAEPPHVEPPHLEPGPAPEFGPPPEEGRPWRRRGRGRGRGRYNPPMA